MTFFGLILIFLEYGIKRCAYSSLNGTSFHSLLPCPRSSLGKILLPVMVLVSPRDGLFP